MCITSMSGKFELKNRVREIINQYVYVYFYIVTIVTLYTNGRTAVTTELV